MKPDLIHSLITRSNVSNELSTIIWMNKRFVRQEDVLYYYTHVFFVHSNYCLVPPI